MSEQNAANGYLAIKKQAAPHTAVTPDVFVPYYNQSLITDPSFISDEPVYGNKFKRFQVLQGLRKHGGSISVMAEPNSAALFADQLATRTGTSGSNPYTHVYGASNSADPNYYTYDISYVSHVVRFWGAQAGKLQFAFNGDQMVINGDISALHSFYAREIASVSGSGPYTVTLATNYDPSPTSGLVVGDLIKFYDASTGTYINAEVDTIENGTQITVSENVASLTAGDILTLRPATPTLNVLAPFTWPRTEFRFGATASAALTAAQTRLDRGSEISVMHEFNNVDGEDRSGAFDPASLARKQYDLEVKVKKFLDTPDDFNDWNTLEKKALVMRAFSGASHELRVTVNNMRALTNDHPTESGGVMYHEFAYGPQYDSSDGQGFSMTVINGLSTI